MTALKDFERLECSGIWRPSPEGQRRDVIVCLGEASLTIADGAGRALAHWSLPAIERINPGAQPALFRPGSDDTETLELTDPLMVSALEKVRNAIERQRPHPGRLRFYLVSGTAALVLGLALFWLPGAMVRYAASVVPPAKRAEIGAEILAGIRRVAGAPCETPEGLDALSVLHGRLFPGAAGRIVVLRDGVRQSEHLPGHVILFNRSLVEDYEDPQVAAGFALEEDARAARHDPVLRLLRGTGLLTSFRLLITGNIPARTLTAYSERLLTAPREPVPATDLLARFKAAGISAKPYAYAIDMTGEKTIDLIEADPIAPGDIRPVMSDGDWVSLQGICGE